MIKRKINKYRKPALVLSGVFLLLFTGLYSPDLLINILLFYIFLTVFLLLLFSFITAKRRAVTITLSIIVILVLRQLKQLGAGNLMVILGINLLLEVYFADPIFKEESN